MDKTQEEIIEEAISSAQGEDDELEDQDEETTGEIGDSDSEDDSDDSAQSDEAGEDDQSDGSEDLGDDTSDEASDDSDEDDDSQSESDSEEAKPVAERIEEISQKFKQTNELSLRQQLEQAEEQLKRDKLVMEADLQKTAVSFPNSQNHNPGGKSVYTMTDGELNDYLTALSDRGEMFIGAQIQSDVLDFKKKQVEIQEKQRNLNERTQDLENKHHIVEWREVGEEFLKALKEIEPFIPQVAEHIDARVQTERSVALQSQTKLGKTEIFYKALEELGVLKKIREKSTDVKIKTPSAPDAKTGSKKVKNKAPKKSWTAEELSSMSQAEFEKNEAAIDKFMDELAKKS